MVTEADVLIVGAGPAGSSAGYFLGKAGLKALIVEQSKFPRDKVCGDGLTPRSSAMMRRLGLYEKLEGRYRSIGTVRMLSPYGVTADMDMPPACFGGKGFVVPRMELDHMLVRNALEAGAELVENEQIVAVRREPDAIVCEAASGNSFRAQMVIAADGANSLIRRKLKLHERADRHGAWAIRAYYSGVKADSPNAFEICWDRHLLPAYGWLFPLEGGKANVGLGIRADDLHKSGKTLPQLFDLFVNENPNMRNELRDAKMEGKPRGHYLPFGSYIGELAADRVLFAGDAAGFIHPLTGEGIEYALESGEAASQVILGIWKAGNREFSAVSLKPYAAECDRRFGHTLRVGTRMQQLFRYPRLVERSMRLAIRDEGIRNEFADILIGNGDRIKISLYRKVLLGF